MKVLHILFSSTYSGAENVACTIIEKIKNDYDVAYCCPPGPIEKVLKEKNIKYIPIKKVSIFELIKVVNRFKPDVIHSHDVRTSFTASFIPGNHKLISHIHGNHPFMRKRTIKSFLYNLRSKRFNHIFWVSDSAFDDYFYNKNIKKKSTILYNVINYPDLINKVSKDNNDYNIDIIFIGRLMEAKNPIRLINIISLIKQKKKDVLCYIVGDGELKEEIQKEIIKKNLEENIKMVGFCSNPYKMLQSSKVMLMTSTHEGMPMVVLEAMALGVPIVSTPIDGIKKMINNECGGLSSNDEELVKYSLEIINNENVRTQKSKIIEKKFKEINNMDDYIKKIIKFY